MSPLPFSVSSLLAEIPASSPSAATWSDKEVIWLVLKIIGGAVAALVPLATFAYRLATRSSRNDARRWKELAEKRGERLKEVEKGGQGPAPIDLGAQLAQAQADLQQAKQEAGELAARVAQAKDAETTQQLSAQKLQADLGSLQQHLDQHQGELAAARRRIQKALQKDGHTWTEKVLLSKRIDFRPLEPDGRRTPIVSVLNLKGGVGKTTLTANLGAALAGMGYRVLLLDLDLQGSLTGLFLPDHDQQRLYEQNRLVGDFLAASFDAGYPNLLNYAHDILPDSESQLVATTDTLAYAEMNLTIRWLLREEGSRDPRFLLRRELQLKRITSRFDIVLLDCPPLINVCCVNALAASDYLLVPVLPSKQATDRVPVLLERLKEFKENINVDLKVMGFVANRTHQSELTYDEDNRLSLLSGQCKDRWGESVPRFATSVRQNPQVRAAEDEHRPLRPEDSMYETFMELAREVESRLPTFCRPGGQPLAGVAS